MTDVSDQLTKTKSVFLEQNTAVSSKQQLLHKTDV